ncbi:hypothetical protein V502_06828 [Pseudogymnoascus sp. VKM F-4520 (FW-2644)]|nr:hypothetical protein V502_06828 [Pseudogymnoascus sp. VKM F-4520 (FW-2644)]
MGPTRDFIWHDENGPWESSRMSRAVSNWTLHYMGRRITLQDWRHLAVAISKKLARNRGVKKADFDNGEDDDDSEQYGVTIDVLKRLAAESLKIFGQVPGAHRATVITVIITPPKWRCVVDAGGLTLKILPLNKAVSEVASEQALLRALWEVLRDDHSQFRTPQQKETVRLAAAKETSLVAILPTGEGKA